MDEMSIVNNGIVNAGKHWYSFFYTLKYSRNREVSLATSTLWFPDHIIAVTALLQDFFLPDPLEPQRQHPHCQICPFLVGRTYPVSNPTTISRSNHLATLTQLLFTTLRHISTHPSSPSQDPTMLRRPATVISLTPDDLAAFESRSIQRIAARKAQADQRFREQKEAQRRKREELERAAGSRQRENVNVNVNLSSVGRSGRRGRNGGEHGSEMPGGLGSGSVAGKGRARGGRMERMGMNMDSSMLGGFDGTASSADPFGRALGSSPRRGGRKRLEEEMQDHSGMDIDLDADVPDADTGAGEAEGDVDLDADVPDMDANSGRDDSVSDEEEEEEEEQEEQEDDAALHTSNIDTSGIDIDMDTPTAPLRVSHQRPPIAAPTRRPRAAPPPLPPPTRPSRRTRTQQQQRQIGYDGANEYSGQAQARPPPPQPSLFARSESRLAHTQAQPPTFLSSLQAQAARAGDPPRYRRSAAAAHPQAAGASSSRAFDNEGGDDDDTMDISTLR